jgi:hypothetical protein
VQKLVVQPWQVQDSRLAQQASQISQWPARHWVQLATRWAEEFSDPKCLGRRQGPVRHWVQLAARWA